MEGLVSSSSESVTGKSSEEDDTLSVLENSPPPPRSDTPMNETTQLLSTDAEKDIVAAPSPQMDLDVADSSTIMVGHEEDEEAVTPLHKRKRTSTANYNTEDGYPKVVRSTPQSEPPVKRSKQSQKIRGVIIGVWRDSDQPDDAEKHVIYGFIDIHDRLRTRIYGMNRRGEELIANAPTGAGGCWVTFERVIFDHHLRGLTSVEVKEYVKIRGDYGPELTEEDRKANDALAVAKCKEMAAELEAMYPGSKPIVHRAARQSLNGRQSLPRQNGQTLHKTPSFQAVNAGDIQTPKASPSSETKPHGVLLGYWMDSDEPRVQDKHAVFGVLSGTDCFRVKVQRVTRDGRYVDGNFPIGAGALWLHYDKVVLEPHLATLSRPEVKEYCRIRQRDLEKRETEKERKANEARAVAEAKAIVADQGLDTGELSNTTPELEVRHSARSEQRMSARNQAESENTAEQARKEKMEARERQNEKTRKEVALAEAVIQGAAHQELKSNLKKLNKVWAAQQAATLPGAALPGMMNGSEEESVKFYNGIKYERKQTGPFIGKLVSNATILTIDGEDYVEYRILTKPSF